jgi:drug/metabolite transporter (DMT)-like permease
MLAGNCDSIGRIVPDGRRRRHSRALPNRGAGDNVLAMYAFARLLQFAALVILPLTIFAQLNESISLGQMLRFLVAGICLFAIGYLLQAYSGKAK